MKADRPTSIDIARLAGVSQITVSRAFTGKAPVSTKTRRRVIEAARQLGYHPNRIAQALKTRQTRQLGIIAPSLTNHFYVDIVHRAQVTAWNRGFDLVLTSSEDWDIEHEIKACHHLMGLHVEGVILLRRSSLTRDEHLRAILDRGMKLLILARQGRINGMSSVDVDMVAGTRMAVEHLLALGHRRLMLVSRHTSAMPPDGRRLGIEAALRDAGLPLSAVEYLPSRGESMQGAYDALSERLKRGDMPTAIIGSNDQAAVGVMTALHDAGARVPQDFSVVGFDNTEYSQFARPSLTTVSQSHLDIGAMAVDILLDAVEHPQHPPSELTLMPKLLVRESTGPCSAT